MDVHRDFQVQELHDLKLSRTILDFAGNLSMIVVDQ